MMIIYRVSLFVIACVVTSKQTLHYTPTQCHAIVVNSRTPVSAVASQTWYYHSLWH